MGFPLHYYNINTPDALASCLVGRCSCGSNLGRDLKNWNLLQSGPSARHYDGSREILQCGCNLRRSPVVLPTAFPSE